MIFRLARTFAAFEVGLVAGVANIALVDATSIAGGTRIPLGAAHEADASCVVAFGTHGDEPPVCVSPSPRGLFMFIAAASHHREDRRQDERMECSRHVTARPDKSRSYNFRQCRMIWHYERSKLDKPSRDPCNCCGTPTASPYIPPVLAPHPPFQHQPCLCPARRATTSNRRAKETCCNAQPRASRCRDAV